MYTFLLFFVNIKLILQPRFLLRQSVRLVGEITLVKNNLSLLLLTFIYYRNVATKGGGGGVDGYRPKLDSDVFKY